jgi:murein DD-endopeptidase MepM/ murein hydrolase activator NlpD
VLAGVTLYAIVATVLLLARPASDGAGGGVRDGAAGGTLAQGSPVHAGADASAAGAAVTPGGSAGSGSISTPATSATPSGPSPGGSSPSLGLWYPIPGAGLPRSDSNLPGAERAYRDGVSQGFDLVDGDVAVPVTYGAAVLAAAQGQVVRADTAYAEMDPRAWQLLLSDVAAGADEEQLDQLRGRQLWIRTSDGATLRYGHLSSIAPGLVVGRSVYRGQVVGFVGNSGTDDGVSGTRDGARLRFEVWQGGDDGDFLGAGLTPDEVRLTAASLFVGP